MRKPFVLTIDVEPDDRVPDQAAAGDWAGLDVCVGWLEELRPLLAERTGRPVRFNWFLRADPQVAGVYGSADWVFRHHGPTLRRLAAAGDGIGLHVHAWRHRPEAGGWVAEHGDAAWVDFCVRSSHSAFRAAWGQSPHAFRFGDHWLSDGLVRTLGRLGFRYDLTIEPGAQPAAALVPGERSSGALPDFRSAPRRPYRPSRRDFRRPARWWPRRLWHVPVTTGCINCGPAVIPARVEDHHAMVHLNLGLDPGWVRGILDATLAAEPLVVSVARTGDAMLAGAPERFRANLEHLAAHPALAERAFVTPAEAVGWWRRQRSAA